MSPTEPTKTIFQPLSYLVFMIPPFGHAERVRKVVVEFFANYKGELRPTLEELNAEVDKHFRRGSDSMFVEWLNEQGLYSKLRDHCTVCKGKSGGVLGNENVVNGVVMCDYCSSKTWDTNE